MVCIYFLYIYFFLLYCLSNLVNLLCLGTVENKYIWVCNM